MTRVLRRFTFWRGVAALILVSGLISTYFRITRGLGATTHLSDQNPWGLWIGFDILCGVGLAAGGFTLAAIVHIFNIRRFEPIIRPTILTAFLGYLLVIVGLMYDLGRPFDIWHAIIMWNPNSVMFEVAWCVMLYTTVLFLEFIPIVFERFRWRKALAVHRAVSIPVIIAGVILSTLHQSSLGSLYLIVPEKLYALWYSPVLPVMFFLSAIAVGCAMVIFESFLSARAFRRGLELELLTDLGRVSIVVLAVYATLKAIDLTGRGAWPLLFVPRMETWAWWGEIAIGVIAPILWLGVPRIRETPRGLFVGAVMVIMGFVLNRINVSVTGLEAWSGIPYVPSWMEVSVTLSIVAFGFIAFALITRYFPVFEHGRGQVGEAWRHRFADDLKQVAERVVA